MVVVNAAYTRACAGSVCMLLCALTNFSESAFADQTGFLPNGMIFFPQVGIMWIGVG